MQDEDHQFVYKHRGFCDNDLLRLDDIVSIEASDAEGLFENAQKLHLNAQHNFILDQILAPYRKVINVMPNPNRAFSFVSLLEEMLNPDGERPLGRTFAARFAMMFADQNQDSIDEFVLFGRRLYDLRSSVIHGSGVARSMDRLMLEHGPGATAPIEIFGSTACLFSSLESQELGADDLPSLTKTTTTTPRLHELREFREKVPMTFLQHIGRLLND